MAFVDPSLISNSTDQKWVDQISKILNRQLAINVETPPVCIFQVPENITTQKPEAYEPQQVGLGPNHHFWPQLYKKMEQKKLAAVQRVLQAHKIKDFELNVLDEVRKLVPVVRACYDMFLQDDDDSLAWVFAIDCLFLLDLFHTYDNAMDDEKEEDQLPGKTESYEYAISLEEIMESDDSFHPIECQRDITIAENQIHSAPMVSSNPPSPRKRPELDLERRFLAQDIMMAEAEITATAENQTHRAPMVSSNPPSPRKQPEVDLERRLLAQDIMMAEAESIVTAENQIHLAPMVSSDPPSQRKRPEVDPKRKLLAQDIVMLQNQIPLMVLKEIRKAWQPSSDKCFLLEDNFSHSMFRSFSEIHSPLELCLPSQAPTLVEHLLHYMYHSIVNNVPLKQIRLQELASINEVFFSEVVPKLDQVPCSLNYLGQTLEFIQKLPRDKIVQLYEQTVATLKTFSDSKTTILSASKLHDIAGVMFCVLPGNKGIRKIKFEEKEFHLPCLTLNSDSEVALRNLVAYEALIAKSDNFPVMEYVGLMCGLIVDANDVKLLRGVNIIKGDLRDDAVAKLFTGMSSSISSKKTKEKSKLQRTIERVNKVYESRPRVMMYLLLKKPAYWLLVVLSAIGSFVGASWKIVAFIMSILTVFMLTWQAYCDVFGCDKSKITLLPYSAG